MPGSVISLGIQVDGEKTFNSAISAIDAEIKSFASGIGAADEAMKAMGGDAEASAKKQDLLAKSVEANNEKMKLLTQQYDNAKARLGELGRALDAARASGDPAAIDKAANAYNRQSVEVSKLSGKISATEKAIAQANNAMNAGTQAADSEGAAMAETGRRSDELAAAVQKMSNIMQVDFAAKAAGMVVNAFKTIVSGAIDAGKAILNLTTEAGAYADTIATLAETSNVDVVNLQKWEYASQFIDTEVSTITGSLGKLEKNMASTNEATAAAFEQLGVSVRDSSGNFRDTEQVFWDVVDALGNVGNQVERENLAMALLGESATKLNPLINAGSEAFKSLGDEAQAAGLILSEDAVGALGNVDDAMNRVNSAITGVKNTVAVAFAPAVEELANGASQVVTAMIGMVNGTEGSTEQFMSAIDNMVDTAVSLLDSMLPTVLDIGIRVITSLVEGILNNIGKITDSITRVIRQLLDTIIKHLPQILKAGVDILLAIIDGIIDAIPQLVSALPQIIEAIVSGLARLAPRLLDVGVSIIKGIWEGIKQGIKSLASAVGGLFGKLLDAIKKLFGIHSPSTVFRDQVGKNMVLGVAEGITQNAGAITAAWQAALPDAAHLTASVDGSTVAARVADAAGTAAPDQDNRPIILQLNDRELGRAVRGYV